MDLYLLLICYVAESAIKYIEYIGGNVLENSSEKDSTETQET